MSEKDILERAKDLVESAEHDKDNSEVITNQENPIPQNKGNIKKERKLGHKREPHFHKPRWYHFLGMGIIIIILLWLLGILMPYIPPVQ